MSKLKLKTRNGRIVIESRKKKKRHVRFKDMTNDVFDTKYGKCEIIKYNNYHDVRIKFIDTGFEVDTSVSMIKADMVKDYLIPSVHDVGYLGQDFVNISKTYPEIYRKVHDTWSGIISRCYNKKNKAYSNYGGNNVTLSEKWLNFSNFFYDIMKLNGWDIEKFLLPMNHIEKITIDKDKHAKNNNIGKIYSLETCCWLTRLEQNNYTSNTKKFIVIHPSNEKTIEYNMNEFARNNNLLVSKISNCVSGKRKSHKGYKFKPYIEKCND